MLGCAVKRVFLPDRALIALHGVPDALENSHEPGTHGGVSYLINDVRKGDPACFLDFHSRRELRIRGRGEKVHMYFLHFRTLLAAIRKDRMAFIRTEIIKQFKIGKAGLFLYLASCRRFI